MQEKRKEWTANSMIGESASDRMPQTRAVYAHSFPTLHTTRQLEREVVW